MEVLDGASLQMPLDGHYSASVGPRRRIAVIGGGISGLGAAYLLAPRNDVKLYEAAPKLGGHARTVIAGRQRQVPVDTGFIVFNYRNYPYLNALFDALDVPVQPSDMSFAATFDDGVCEYGTQTLKALFADRRNLFRVDYWQMLRDILRFNANAVQLAEGQPEMCLGTLLDQLGMGDWFRNRFLLPISGAIWSTSPPDMMSFPALAFTRFFENHGLLSVKDQLQWWTVRGGSREYVSRLAKAIEQRGGRIRAGTPVESVTRSAERVVVRARRCEPEIYDEVVFANHSDQALAILQDADGEEHRSLGALRYKANQAYLHDDERVMPRRRKCWASWVYKGPGAGNVEDISLTYWMNRLQNLPHDQQLFVTLNPTTPIEEKYIFDQMTFYHPQFDQEAPRAQRQILDLNGRRRTWFCGAYLRNGFHEDGLWSAVQVAQRIGATVAWA